MGGEISRRKAMMIAGAAITASVAGCTGRNEDDESSNGGTNNGAEFPIYDLPAHSEWVPTERHDADGDLFFTHLDWAALDELDDENDPENDDETSEIIEEIPILGLPLYGASISPLILFGIMFYPFAGDVIPEDGQTVEGVGTSTMTWTDEIVVFHGEFDSAVFAEQYTDGFEEATSQDEFTFYVGADEFTDGQAYAVSEDTLIVGLTPGEDAEYTPEELVTAALDRYSNASDRVVDDEDGQWLFETTGDAQMALGAWETDDLLAALDPDDEIDEDVEEEEPEAEPDVENNPVFDDVESLINNIVFTVENGEMQNIEARFSGIYPEDAVPSEDEVREHLIGEEEIPHEISIDGRRVHAIATFEELSS